jgi:hypothetical protein
VVLVGKEHDINSVDAVRPFSSLLLRLSLGACHPIGKGCGAELAERCGPAPEKEL